MVDNKSKLTQVIMIRVTEFEKNRLRMLAEIYSNGNLSAFIINRSLYSDRKFIENDDFEWSERRVRPKSHPPKKIIVG